MRQPQGGYTAACLHVDTSAALKLVIAEDESARTADYLTTAASQGDTLAASMLLYTELPCAGRRRGIPGDLINTALSGINLVDVARPDLMYGAALPGKLRSADAIHLATAIRLQADVLVAYHAELLAAAVEAGFAVQSPS
ncbi:type II toxin-antitoxin system VapC family toxin [Pseudarthrobacter phenanthrenivorans]|uniref:type II toxin-antitoxin system VapC family toxin n=1 Tax=Pseudarthrobacter phenanthrenivorans TaxID=361575 RepID=UPI001127C600|nr:type II toxin-antitoxin system VapC family toxin [Pseudarthrobacter phenanthrenivorans]TPV48623.1 type II toxin-antitoxin system VapC family toxin [Pseudarthrobacter phenanthrenivorans]